MKASIVEYNNETGKILKKGKVDYYYSDGTALTKDIPNICISLPDRTKTIAVSIDLPLNQLLEYLRKKKIIGIVKN